MKGCLKLIGYGLAALVVLSVIVAIFGNNTDRPSSTTTTQRANSQVEVLPTEAPTATPVPPTPTPEWMAPPFKDICDGSTNRTEIQNETLAEAMVGKKVIGWTGAVYDVQRSGDTFRVEVDMRGGFIRSRQIDILGVGQDIAAILNVDQEITFDGTIQSVDMAFGVLCNPLVLVDATIKGLP
jgi:hypothetical protein